MTLIIWVVFPFDLAAAEPATFIPSQRVQGVGKDRENSKAIGLDIRTDLIKHASRFYILRQEKARAAPARIFGPELWPIIQRSAQAKGIDPMIMAAVIYIESFGDCNARSSSAAGCAQFTRQAAREEGLRVVTKRGQTGTRTITRGRGKTERKVVVPVYGTVYVRDDRLDPTKAIPAMANRLSKRIESLGRVDFSIAEYHMGWGYLTTALSLYSGQSVDYKNVRKVVGELSYPQVFFNNTPRYKAGLYNFLGRLADYSPTYYFRIMAGLDLLKLYRQNPAKYEAEWKKYQPKFPNHEVTPNRMWSYYGPDDVARLGIADLPALQAAWKNGRIKTLPNASAKLGVNIRTTSKSPIAERDLKNRQWYMGSEPATLGCLLYIAYELRQLQGNAFVPLETNSLVRHLKYQDALGGRNTNARTQLPTHALGKAFDLPRTNLNRQQERDLTFILEDLESLGLLGWILEGAQRTIHVVPNPEYQGFFAGVYYDAVKFVDSTR